MPLKVYIIQIRKNDIYTMQVTFLQQKLYNTKVKS